MSQCKLTSKSHSIALIPIVTGQNKKKTHGNEAQKVVFDEDEKMMTLCHEKFNNETNVMGGIIESMSDVCHCETKTQSKSFIENVDT